jgi:hypothetical protein
MEPALQLGLDLAAILVDVDEVGQQKHQNNEDDNDCSGGDQ